MKSVLFKTREIKNLKKKVCQRIGENTLGIKEPLDNLLYASGCREERHKAFDLKFVAF